jgi:hypothetical protein
VKGHTRVRGAAAVLALLVPLLAVFVSCHGEQTLHSDCVDNAGVCPPCTSDEQCGIISNACTPHAYCTHRDREPPLAVTQIGCNIGYDEPPPARCGCVAGVCRAR